MRLPCARLRPVSLRFALTLTSLATISSASMGSVDPIYPPLDGWVWAHCSACDYSKYFTCRSSACNSVAVWTTGGRIGCYVKFQGDPGHLMDNVKPSPTIPPDTTDHKVKRAAQVCGMRKYHLDALCVGDEVPGTKGASGWQYNC